MTGGNTTRGNTGKIITVTIMQIMADTRNGGEFQESLSPAWDGPYVG